ncbi:unnamed protein product [Zymoseptoria tritici ST99CH_1A5]|uniref:Sin1 middle CRIM domain-containing protein n=3 Tax=Zymoseptoria tritici TaxID=1047171 RepID=A0A1X7RN11_ZYMT9|nr:unnamed protein product [Zymoseptoria tritici ST99CH_3D7]SMR48386.1 unnamed protein product [Zymoseptoria tritici ST99CH_1E4]SMR49598.1 unnamed protein product [Zymoseptoria tritici ST99CH_3D1]SMY22295.1 unnamed protein product [Zymoseptoria tritici ST99CH_1A5]
MSLLMNEEFSIYQLRLGYLNQIHDGVGERLINLNPAVLNNPAFRTAGWVPDTAAIKRCYSPPIPTGTSDFSNEYFHRPQRRPTAGQFEDEDGRGMVTGQGSEDTLGPTGLRNERKRERRRRKEQVEEDDSSDLSDDSDEDEKGPAQSIKFSKMPVRHRAHSSPPREPGPLVDDGPALLITSPSRPPESTLQRLRSGSAGAVEAVKQRARRDTATSSDMSSDNDVAPSTFKRKLPGRPGKGPSMLAVEDDIMEEEDNGNNYLEDDDDIGEASDLSDEFEGTADSPSMLGIQGANSGISTSSLRRPEMPPAITPANNSPRKQQKELLPKLPKLPPGQRPMSMAQPTSMISMMLKGSPSAADDKPFQRFAVLSGKDETNPLWIKIYAPFSETPTKPVEVPLKRTKDDRPITVSELIGLALWRYVEEDFKPPLQADEGNINHWTLRIVEDEEIDFDFPALARTRPVVDFTSNNNRPPQRRARDKPWDEFGLVKATPEQFKENEQLTPQLGEASRPAKTAVPVNSANTQSESAPRMPPAPLRRGTSDGQQAPVAPSFNPARNPITGPSFAPSALKKDASTRLDLPQREARQGASKTGAPRTVIVHHTDLQTFAIRSERFETTTDSYIAEIFESTCTRLGLERALYVLKVHGTQTVAPPDRTIEALGDRLQLDLVQRRFPGTGMGLSGSPGSSSPNAPLELTPANATPSHARKKGMKGLMYPLTAQQQRSNNVDLQQTSSHILGIGQEGKRYNVLRKQPLSFAATHPRTLIITPEYITVMPAAPGSLAAPTGKVTNVPMSSVIGAKVSRKHPKMVRILVFREKETKRYDFEAATREEAEEIVADVRKGMEVFGLGIGE